MEKVKIQPRKVSSVHFAVEAWDCLWGAECCADPNVVVHMKEFTDECGHVVGFVCEKCEPEIMSHPKSVCDCGHS